MTSSYGVAGHFASIGSKYRIESQIAFVTNVRVGYLLISNIQDISTRVNVISNLCGSQPVIEDKYNGKYG